MSSGTPRLRIDKSGKRCGGTYGMAKEARKRSAKILLSRKMIL